MILNSTSISLARLTLILGCRWIDFVNFFCPTSSSSSGLKHIVKSLAFKHDHRVVESSFQHPRNCSNAVHIPGVPQSLFC